MDRTTDREASLDDVPAMASLRERSGMGRRGVRGYHAAEYCRRARSPHFLGLRVVFLANFDASAIGYIAGHLTTRFGCDGELQWLLVAPDHRGGPTATRLLRRLAGWFDRHSARRYV